MSRSKFFQEGRLLAKLSGPIVIGQVGQNLIILADTLMVGALGAAALGASAFAGGLFFVFLVFGLGVLSPIAALVAKAQGQENDPYAGVLLRHSVALALGLSLLLFLLLYTLMPQMELLGQTPEVLLLGRSFLEIIAWSILPSLIYQAYKQFTDGIGNTKIGMYVMIFGVVSNILGNWVLINGYWGFPALGLKGAAWATLISRTAMALAMIAAVHVTPSLRRYLQERWTLHFDSHLLKSMIRLGMPTGLTSLFEVGAFASAAIMMGWFGSAPLAAHQITISLASMTFLVTVGVGIAASVRVGYEIGRGDYALARFAGFTAIQVGAVYMGICALGFLLLRDFLPTFYVDDLDVISWSAKFFLVVAIFQIFDGIQAIAVGALRGMSDTQWPSVIAFIAFWILGLPLGYLLAFHGGVGPVGIWAGLLIGLMCASVLLTWRYHILSRRLELKSLA